MFLNEKACQIMIALNSVSEATITRLANMAGANLGYTSNTLLKAVMWGFVEQERRNRETVVRITPKGREIAAILEKAMEKIGKPDHSHS